MTAATDPSYPELYLYLTEASWCDSWVHGGTIPINPASFYRRSFHDGIFTADEVLHRNPGKFPDWAVGDNAVIRIDDPHINFTVKGGGKIIGADGREFQIEGSYEQWQDDAHILSFSTVASKDLMDRLGKQACIKLRDPAVLKTRIDAQLGVTGSAGPVAYTNTADRNHFTKGMSTEWQSEYRFVWRTDKSGKVVISIPPNSGESIDLG